MIARQLAAFLSNSFAWHKGLPYGWVRRLPSLNEFFVHHEDVRRANGRGPRTTEHELDEALWRNVSRASWFLARRLHGAGLELQWTGTASTIRARRGEPTARISPRREPRDASAATASGAKIHAGCAS
jgi:hypothetical protein